MAACDDKIKQKHPDMPLITIHERIAIEDYANHLRSNFKLLSERYFSTK